MIVVEHSLRSIVGTIDAIRLNDNVSNTPFFGWGHKHELKRYLLKKPDAYPLIWLLPTPDPHTDRGTSVLKTCEFVIATRETNKDLYNDERYLRSFDVVLNPLTDTFIQKLRNSKLSAVRDLNWAIFNYPNYSETDKNFTIDLWDAKKLTIEVKFNDGCIP